MVQLILLAKFKRQILQWYGATVTMKEPSGLLEKKDLTSLNIREVVVQTVEPVFTR